MKIRNSFPFELLLPSLLQPSWYFSGGKWASSFKQVFLKFTQLVFLSVFPILYTGTHWSFKTLEYISVEWWEFLRFAYRLALRWTTQFVMWRFTTRIWYIQRSRSGSSSSYVCCYQLNTNGHMAQETCVTILHQQAPSGQQLVCISPLPVQQLE